MGVKITGLADSGSTVVLGADLLLTVDTHSSPNVTRKVTVSDLFTSYPTSPFDPTMRGRVRSVVHTNTGSVTLSTGTTSQGDLMTFSIPANNMTDAGNQVKLEAWGTTSGSTGSVNIKLHFGGSVVIESTVTSTAGTWLANATVINIDSSSSEVIASFVEGSNHIIARSLSSVRSTAVIITRVTGQKAATTTVDVFQEGFIVDFAS